MTGKTASGGTVTRQEAPALGADITQQTAQAVAAAAGRVHEAWTARDTDRRVALLAEACAEDVAYANPVKSCVGVQALAALISELTATYPGYLPVRTSGVDAHHDAARYEWALRDRAGQAVLGGLEIVRFTPEARLTSIVSFVGQPPTIRYTYQA
ncbi:MULTISPECIES: hypothetical protein [Pseudofrankia]|uniref:hypothetical protein n=1 Tax=Pseudofrankia TaxID=2994363 RepID=UPI000234BEE1|nr:MULTISPECIES: hypothetical protein [Pseudofrankia]OHV41363.1 hypothetical protein BCD49_07725 [Pseudofrankia sp. EUN1h]